MKKILLVLLTVALMFTAFSFVVSADTADATEVSSATESEKDDMGVELDFQPTGFARNLKYMGLGMLGIFVVVGVVIAITFGLNAATAKKQ